MKTKTKIKKSPADQIKEQFLAELHKLIPAHLGLQMMITSLVDKYYDPKVYNVPKLKTARQELSKMVREHCNPDETVSKPTMDELMEKASEILKMA